MNSSIIVMFLCAFAFATINALPNDNRVQGKSIAKEGMVRSENSKFEVQPKNKNGGDGDLKDNIMTKSLCGWAANPSACSSACYYLGWPYYTFWVTSGDCCCLPHN